MASCSYCRQPIAEGLHPFTLRMELFPAIEPSLEISEADLKRDHKSEWDRLMQMMDQMSDSDVAAQEKLMYLTRSFTLCRKCRDLLAAQLDRLEPPAS